MSVRNSLLRWLISLVTAISVLILIGYGAAQNQTQNLRCIQFSSTGIWRMYTLDTQTGNVLIDKREGLIRGHSEFIQEQRNGTRVELVRFRADRVQPVILESGEYASTSFAYGPYRREFSYTMYSASHEPWAVWGVLNLADGHIDRISIGSDDFPFFMSNSGRQVSWSPDESRIAMVLSNPQSSAVRLYVRDRKTSAFVHLDLPNLINVTDLMWAPDGQTLAALGDDSANPRRGRITFYSVSDGQVLSRPGGTDDVPRFMDRYHFVWSPDSRYLLILGTDSYMTRQSGWDVFGINGEVYINLTTPPTVIGWRQTDSQLVFLESKTSPFRLQRLVAFDPDIGRREALINNALSADLFTDMRSFLVATQQKDGSAAVDRYDLVDGSLKRVLGGMDRFDGYESKVWSTTRNALRWYDKQRFHVTFLDARGQVQQDFIGLPPTGNVIAANNAKYAGYEWQEVGARDWNLDLLNLESGKRYWLTTVGPGVIHTELYIYGGIVEVHKYISPSYDVENYSLEGAPIPVNKLDKGAIITASPDNRYAVRWTQSGRPTYSISDIAIRFANGTMRTIETGSANYGSPEVVWSPDSAYVALIRDTDNGDGWTITNVKFYTAAGDLLWTTDFAHDLGLNHISWTTCN